MTRAAFLLTTLALGTCCLAGAPLRAQQEKSPLDPLLDRIKAIPGQADKPFSMIVQFKVKRDQVDSVLAAARKAVPASRAEKGCVAYDVQQNLEDPTEFFVLETCDAPRPCSFIPAPSTSLSSSRSSAWRWRSLLT